VFELVLGHAVGLEIRLQAKSLYEQADRVADELAPRYLGVVARVHRVWRRAQDGPADGLALCGGGEDVGGDLADRVGEERFVRVGQGLGHDGDGAGKGEAGADSVWDAVRGAECVAESVRESERGLQQVGPERQESSRLGDYIRFSVGSLVGREGKTSLSSFDLPAGAFEHRDLSDFASLAGGI
jgi:hypothetical protein